MPILNTDPIANAVFYAAALLGLLGLGLQYGQNDRKRTVGAAAVCEAIVVLLFGWLQIAHANREPVGPWVIGVSLIGFVVVPLFTWARIKEQKRVSKDPVAAAAFAVRDRKRARFGKIVVLSLPLAACGFLAAALVGGGGDGWNPSTGAGTIGAILGVALAWALVGRTARKHDERLSERR
jgi:predicted permease